MRKVYALIIMLLVGLSSNAFAQCTSCSLSGPSSITRGSTTTFSTASGSGYSYFWSVTGGLQLMSGNTGTSVTVKAASGTSGTICITRYGNSKTPCSSCRTISITDPGGCTLSSVTVTKLSGTCSGTTFTYRATPNGSSVTGATYSWNTIGNNVSIISGQGTNTVTIRANTPNFNFIGAQCTVTACGTSKTGAKGELCEDPCGQFICEINAFPNPTQTGFTVFLNKGSMAKDARVAQDLKIQILNKQGEVIKDMSTTQTELFIDTESFSNGIYLVRVIAPNGESQTETIVVNK